MSVKIISNYHWREFKYRYEVPENILESEFDWCDSLDNFFCYRGTWYHLSEFLRTELDDWLGYKSDSFFSGIVINISRDGEYYQVGTYIS